VPCRKGTDERRPLKIRSLLVEGWLLSGQGVAANLQRLDQTAEIDIAIRPYKRRAVISPKHG
jgi:hypothetical protein